MTPTPSLVFSPTISFETFFSFITALCAAVGLYFLLKDRNTKTSLSISFIKEGFKLDPNIIFPNGKLFGPTIVVTVVNSGKTIVYPDQVNLCLNNSPKKEEMIEKGTEIFTRTSDKPERNGVIQKNEFRAPIFPGANKIYYLPIHSYPHFFSSTTDEILQIYGEFIEQSKKTKRTKILKLNKKDF